MGISLLFWPGCLGPRFLCAAGLHLHFWTQKRHLERTGLGIFVFFFSVQSICCRKCFLNTVHFAIILVIFGGVYHFTYVSPDTRISQARSETRVWGGNIAKWGQVLSLPEAGRPNLEMEKVDKCTIAEEIYNL